VPEYAAAQLLQSLETPYRAYEAGDSDALQKAIDDVDRLEKLPITYRDLVPRRDLAPWAARRWRWPAVLLLLAARLVELRRWA
jgi:mxaC protein